MDPIFHINITVLGNELIIAQSNNNHKTKCM